jgi:hypothetical protein
MYTVNVTGSLGEPTMKNDLNTIDTLGTLLAQIAELEKQAEAIKDDLKDSATAPGGSKVFEGDLFKATVVESNRSTIDWKKLAADLGITAEQLAGYTKVAAVFSVKVTSR